MGNPEWGVDVTWQGHSCFTLKDSVGRTVVMDPFDATVGYGQLRLRADALLITHNHFDHNYKRAVVSRSRNIDLMESSGTVTVADMPVTGIPSDHDKAHGNIHGRNRIFVFFMGGVSCATLGDLGQEKLTEEQRRALGSVDVLFIPVGGVTTIDAIHAKALVDELKPIAVFPMHYGDARFYHLDPVEKFLSLFPDDQVKRLKESTVRIKKPSSTSKPIVYTLTPTEKNY
jgi:L-ascorbate metabolism protein UlaG (beta-lactamase superfamily)